MQIAALKAGQAVDKPIYNHVTGLLDPPERIESPKVCEEGWDGVEIEITA